MPTIHIKNASLYYAAETIFEGLNLTITAQKTIALLGCSGVGKSSLLKLLANLIDAKHANITADINTTPKLELQHNIAYMAQDDLLLPWLTVKKNTLLGARLQGKVSLALQQRAHKLLDAVGLTAAAKKYPAQLSGGMRQRVALARTLLQDKPIVLMDEPFSALDAITRLELQSLTAQLLREKTVVFVTHDPLEALRLADEIYVLVGSPAKINEAIIPPGRAPRAITDPTILQLQGQLLSQLENSRGSV